MADHTSNGNFTSASLRLKTGLAEMLKGGVIMDVMNVEQARIAEEAGAISRSEEHTSELQSPC